jgi:maleate isomerase
MDFDPGRPSVPVWGERAPLGFIDLSTSIVMSAEMPRALRQGVAALMTRMRLPGGEVSAEALKRMVDSQRLEEAARELADGEVQVIVFGCTTGSLLGGPRFDRELVSRMERAAGVTSTTTSTALLAALRVLGATRLGVATPYIDELNELEARFLRSEGFEMVSMRGLAINSDAEIARVPYSEVRRLAHNVAPGTDAVFLSSTAPLSRASR